VSTIDDALIARAAAFAGLTGLIGIQPNMRLYPVDAVTQNADRPYATYQLISGPPEHAMGSDPGMVRARFQFSCWGDTSTDARSVGDQVRAGYRRFRGTLLGVEILDVFVDNERDLGREPDTRLYHRVVDLIVWYRE
jgi:hypothetical protein